MGINIQTVALIGSFRQHYKAVMEAFIVFQSSGLQVTSPKGTPIVKEGIPFVRFESDPDNWCDAMVQSVALHRILSADFVYLVSPAGYVGRTTCYEVGRIIQAQRPLYFSNDPEDLPISVPPHHVCSVQAIVNAIHDKNFFPIPLWCDGKTPVHELEKDSINGQFRNI